MIPKKVVALSRLALTGCMNMPPPAQISSAYVSPLKYEPYDCSRLIVEQSSLTRKNSWLPHEWHIKTSETQAFWYGYPVKAGNCVEASELANVRESVKRLLTLWKSKGARSTDNISLICEIFPVQGLPSHPVYPTSMLDKKPHCLRCIVQSLPVVQVGSDFHAHTQGCGYAP